MSVNKIIKSICGDSPGQRTDLIYYRAGPEDACKKVFLQAALHADEQPGILILHHLLEMLAAADEAGLLKAEFVIFPVVNPTGMANIEFGHHQGRFDRASGVNFNRQWPDLFTQVGATIGSNLTTNAEENIEIVRACLAEWVATLPVITAQQQLRQAVISEAYNADYVFDLHCDDDALLHIYTVPQIADEMQRLANWTCAAATLLAEDSGSGSFDEVWPLIWIKLAQAHPDKPLPMPVRTCTIEYRGRFDTFDALNRRDAENLYGYFQAESLIDGDLQPLPGPARQPSDLRSMELVRVDRAGLIAFCVDLGDAVRKGDRIANLIELDGDEAFIARIPVLAGTDGFILSRCITKYAWRNAIIAKIVGNDILDTRGASLLTD